ncbi:MAG: redoxin domain-containing protein [Planctomycetota bacterium]|nr:redoxin domain-containing protein [Planctomycetota bacterium]
MRNILFTCTALTLLAFAPIRQEAPKLAVGDQAPSVDGLEFVQGELVSDSKVRVVEFWATWCGPCKTSIPHINELYQAQSANGLEVIGVTTETRTKVEPFVRQRGSQMSYTVALDPEKKISAAFMEAAGQNGIPCAFVIGQNRKIVFIGHPMDPEFTKAVKLSMTGRYDPKLLKQAAPSLEAARNAIKSKNFKDAYRRFDEVVALDPVIFSDISIEKYRVMLNDEKNETGAKNYAAEMAKAFADAGDITALRDLALTLSSDPQVSVYDNDLALVVAEAMLKSASSSDPNANATLASVYYARGEFAKAVSAQKKAIRLAIPNAKVLYKPTLDAYELAVKRGTKVAVPVASVPQEQAKPDAVPQTVPVGTP